MLSVLNALGIFL